MNGKIRKLRTNLVESKSQRVTTQKFCERFLIETSIMSHKTDLRSSELRKVASKSTGFLSFFSKVYQKIKTKIRGKKNKNYY